MLLYMIASLDEHDHSKATKIFEKYYSTMMYVANTILKDKTLSEDAISEAMIKIIKNLHKIEINDCYKTRRFIVIIVENVAKTIWKKRKNMLDDGDDVIDDLIDESISVLDELRINEGIDCIVNAINSLPKSLSDVLYLSAVMELSDIEIAKELSISHNAVRMRLSRARKAIKRVLRGEGYEHI